MGGRGGDPDLFGGLAAVAGEEGVGLKQGIGAGRAVCLIEIGERA